MSRLLLWVFVLAQSAWARAKKKDGEQDFRDIVKCDKVERSFPGMTCKSPEPLGRGAKSLAFLVTYKGQDRVLLIQKKNATEAMRIREEIGDHPSIIHIDRFRATKNWSFYIMEYGQEGSLSDFRRSRKKQFQDPTFVLKFLEKIVDGLIHISKRGFVHSDLKLANIVVDADFHPKIIDFELATRKNRKYYWRGTTSYMAPEVLRAVKKDNRFSYTEKIDVYAVGVMAYRMLFGDYPYEERDRPKLLEDIRRERFYMPEGFDVATAWVMANCLQYRKKDRWTLEQLKEGIGQALKTAGRRQLWRFDSFSPMEKHLFLENKRMRWTEDPWGASALGVIVLLWGSTIKGWTDRGGSSHE